jgi:hypothetical protein
VSSDANLAGLGAKHGANPAQQRGASAMRPQDNVRRMPSGRMVSGVELKREEGERPAGRRGVRVGDVAVVACGWCVYVCVLSWCFFPRCCVCVLCVLALLYKLQTPSTRHLVSRGPPR